MKVKLQIIRELKNVTIVPMIGDTVMLRASVSV